MNRTFCKSFTGPLALALLLVLLLHLNSNSLFGQGQATFQEVPTTPDQNEVLGKYFADWQILRLVSSPGALPGGNQMILDWQVSGHPLWRLELEKNDLRQPEAISTETRNGVVTEVNPSACYTYKGRIGGGADSDVRLSLYPGRWSGYLRNGNEVVFLEPLQDLLPGSAMDLYLSYRVADVLPVAEPFCLADRVQERGERLRQDLEEHHQHNDPGSGERAASPGGSIPSDGATPALYAAGDIVSNCTFLELATEADYEWFTDFGSTVASANAQILSLLNQVEGLYCSSFDMSFRVVYQNVHTSVVDPYTSTTLLARLGEFRDLWNSTAPYNTVSRDLAHMFTGTNLAGSAVGYAWVGVVCSSGLGYGITQHYTAGLYGQVVIVAHEMGHNFSSPHSTSVSCGSLGSVMCPYVQPNSFYFSAATVAQINSHIATRTCLGPPGLTVSPVSASLCVSSPALFSVPFDPSWTYQWYLDSVAIGGATSNTLSASVPGTYIVDISNYDTTCTTCSVSLVATLSGSNLLVTNTNDAGPGSLREAITNANSCPGWDTIQFAIPGPGPHVIAPNSALPVVTDTLFVDGYSQAGALRATSGVPANLQVVLDGSGAGFCAGIEIRAPFSRVSGMSIHSFSGFAGSEGVGIYFSGIYGMADGNYLGTDPGGSTALPNQQAGIKVDGRGSYTRIGDGTAGGMNVASGNGTYGIRVESVGGFIVGVVIEGNRVGTNRLGTAPLPNQRGISISQADSTVVGGPLAGQGNLVSGNTLYGIHLERFAQNSRIQGNRVGTDLGGTYAIPNGGAPSSFPYRAGIQVEASNNLIGGAGPGEGNLVSGNEIGIHVAGAFSAQQTPVAVNNVVIQGNRIGTDVSGTLPLGNQATGILFAHVGSAGTSNPVSSGPESNLVGGLLPGEENLIAFNGYVTTSTQPYHLSGVGFRSSGGVRGDTKVYRNQIRQNAGLGIAIDPFAFTNPSEYKAPILNAALVDCATSTTTVTGELQANDPLTDYRIELFYNFFPDPSGFGEGEFFLGALNVTTDGTGNVPFSAVYPAMAVPTGTCISATATALDTGNTSEFSNYVCLAPVPLVIAPQPDLSVCEGDPVNLVDFNPAVDVTYTIPGVGTFSSDTLSYVPLGAGDSIYILSVDTCGRIALDTVSALVLAPPNPDLGPDTLICPGDTLFLAPGGGSSYQWQDLSTGTDFDAVASGLYHVAVTDVNGCTGRDSVVLLVDGPVVDLGPDTVFCSGGILDAGFLNGAGYAWNTGETSSFVLVDSAGTYAVEVTDSNGCRVSDTVQVNLDTVFVDLGPDTLYVGGDSLDAGNGGCSYAWSTGETGQVIFPPGPGSYQVTVTCPSGCSYVDEIVLDPGPLFDGDIWLSAEAGASGVNLHWSFSPDLDPERYRLLRNRPGEAAEVVVQGEWPEGLTDGVHLDPVGAGSWTYQVLAEGANGESLASNPVTVWMAPGLEWSVYPVPADGALTVRWSLPDGQGASIEVSDLLGRAVWQGRVAGSGEQVLDCGVWAEGMYLVRLKGAVQEVRRVPVRH